EAQRTVLRSPARVLQRQKELRAELKKRGVPEEVLAERSLGKQAGEVPGGGRIEAGGRGPVARWAAFGLSGDPRWQGGQGPMTPGGPGAAGFRVASRGAVCPQGGGVNE